MASDEQIQAIRINLHVAKEKAEAVLSDSHTGADAKNSIQSLIKVADSFNSLISTATGATADARIIKKRLEQARFDNRILIQKWDESRKSVLAMATELEMLRVEADGIIKRNSANPSSPELGSANRIKASALRIIDVVKQFLSITPPNNFQ
jgi:hypothetical protein